MLSTLEVTTTLESSSGNVENAHKRRKCRQKDSPLEANLYQCSSARKSVPRTVALFEVSSSLRIFLVQTRDLLLSPSFVLALFRAAGSGITETIHITYYIVLQTTNRPVLNSASVPANNNLTDVETIARLSCARRYSNVLHSSVLALILGYCSRELNRTM